MSGEKRANRIGKFRKVGKFARPGSFSVWQKKTSRSPTPLSTKSPRPGKKERGERKRRSAQHNSFFFSHEFAKTERKKGHRVIFYFPISSKVMPLSASMMEGRGNKREHTHVE